MGKKNELPKALCFTCFFSCMSAVQSSSERGVCCCIGVEIRCRMAVSAAEIKELKG